MNLSSNLNNQTVPLYLTANTLTNFTATIKSNVVQDNGVEQAQIFEIEAKLNGITKSIPVPSTNFASMNWIIDGMGPSAVIYAGYGAKDHARAAIQLLSENHIVRTICTHTGWRENNENCFYLTGNGAIGSDGFVDSVEIGLPNVLDKYNLVEPENKKGLVCAIEASLSLLDIAPEHITFPLYCAIWRSILGGADYSIHVVGPTGTGKSVISALVQQHFGSAMDSRSLPGSWSSTANALEGLAFTVKDAIFVIDDFAPDGTKNDAQRLHKDAARIFRAQGNHSGRQRMNANSSLRVTKPPRGLILSTGEDTPLGQSIRARLFILELSQADLDWSKVSICQKDAEKGLYEKATFGFVRWMAPKYKNTKDKIANEIAQLRNNATALRMHKRTPEMIASQYVGMKYFIGYAKDAGAITESKAEELLGRCWNALSLAGNKQITFQMAMEPAQRFIELISSALSSGRAHIVNKDGEEPPTPNAYGWVKASYSAQGYNNAEWVRKGEQIGWIDEGNIYLNPDVSYRIAQNMGGDNGLTVTIGTLKKRLKEKNLIIAEAKRETLTVRRKFQGREHNVLLLNKNVLMLQKPDISDISDDLPDHNDKIPFYS